ncbi:MAG: helix-turn-helix domain-containing protein [Acidobacteria bacterium]|nr:helix-turn-helix domain-containing protein [Acidobacteriota bacterium]MCA1638803.1 helix-turn-helix domain-containing protein [Acidobacteriota bacterium]
MKDCLTTAEAAKRLNVDPSRIQRMILDGVIRAEKFGHDNVITEVEMKRIEQFDRKRGRPIRGRRQEIKGRRKMFEENFEDRERVEHLRRYLVEAPEESFKKFPDGSITDRWAISSYEQMDEDLQNYISYEDFSKSLTGTINEIGRLGE